MTLSWQLSRIGGAVLGGTDLAGFSTVDLGNSRPAAVALEDNGGTLQPPPPQQQHAGDSSSSSGKEGLDEVLCYELVPGQPSTAAAGSSVPQQGALRTSAQGQGAPAALVQQQQGLNPRAELKPWWSGGSVNGMVRLGRAGGALSAVEVVVVPTVAGRQLPPRLMLRSLGGSQPLLVECGVAGGLRLEGEACLSISA